MGHGVYRENAMCLFIFWSLLYSNTQSPSDSQRLGTSDQSNLFRAGSDAHTLCQTALVLGSASVQDRTGKQVSKPRRPKWNRAKCRMWMAETGHWVMDTAGHVCNPSWGSDGDKGIPWALHLASLANQWLSGSGGDAVQWLILITMQIGLRST